MPETRSTMQDVAREAGVHAATVSRALRNCAGVSAEVRSKVLQVASKLGYRPNPLVSALIRSRRNRNREKYHATLAFLLPQWPAASQSYREDYRQLIAGATKRAGEYGYRLEEFSAAIQGMSPHRLSEILAARNIAGLILPPLHSVQETVAVEWTRFPTMAVGYSHRIPVSRVVHNHALAVHVALAKCRRQGCGRIGIVLPRRVSEKVENRWLSAYLIDQFQHQDSASALPPLLLGEGEDEATFAPWLAKNRPDAILGLQHLTPIRRWLKSTGRRVPQDVSLVTLDYKEEGPKFAGVYHDHPLLGAVAVEQLVGMVEHNDPATNSRGASIVIDGVWRDGPTLKIRGP